MSWIHETDFVRAVLWLIEHDELEGPVNVAAPNPLPNAEFMQSLRETWGHPLGIPAPAWALELGAFILHSETELILKSRRVVPTKLLDSGFKFRFPRWTEAAAELVHGAHGLNESMDKGVGKGNPFRANQKQGISHGC